MFRKRKKKLSSIFSVNNKNSSLWRIAVVEEKAIRRETVANKTSTTADGIAEYLRVLRLAGFLTFIPWRMQPSFMREFDNISRQRFENSWLFIFPL